MFSLPFPSGHPHIGPLDLVPLRSACLASPTSPRLHCTQVVFRYALAIFKYNEEGILQLQDGLEIYQYLRFFTKTICDSR